MLLARLSASFWHIWRLGLYHLQFEISRPKSEAKNQNQAPFKARRDETKATEKNNNNTKKMIKKDNNRNRYSQSYSHNYMANCNRGPTCHAFPFFQFESESQFHIHLCTLCCNNLIFKQYYYISLGSASCNASPLHHFLFVFLYFYFIFLTNALFGVYCFTSPYYTLTPKKGIPPQRQQRWWRSADVFLSQGCTFGQEGEWFKGVYWGGTNCEYLCKKRCLILGGNTFFTHF